MHCPPLSIALSQGWPKISTRTVDELYHSRQFSAAILWCADSGAHVLPLARATVPPWLHAKSAHASSLLACCALGPPACVVPCSCRREPCTGRSAWLPLGRACRSAWIEHRVQRVALRALWALDGTANPRWLRGRTLGRGPMASCPTTIRALARIAAKVRKVGPRHTWL
jgi:hypothetical protein